jgi:hypothetical protein
MLTNTQKEEMVKLRESGSSFAQISERFGTAMINTAG